jgi:hypothetical protein
MKMQHEMSILGKNGDTKVFWDPANADSVSAASITFHSYIGRGYTAARMSNGGTGEALGEFDPNAGSILFVPPLQGG